MAMAFTGCRRPDEKIFPRVYPKEYLDPGNINYIATAIPLKNNATGTLIKTVADRPIKIEGNPMHPVSQGKSSKYMQSEIYSLYDPDRFRSPEIAGYNSTIDECIAAFREQILENIANNKETAIIIDEHCSPTYNQMIRTIEENYKSLKFYKLPPFFSPEAGVNQKIFGINAEFMPDLSNCDYILSLGSDFLGTDRFSLNYSTQLNDNEIPYIDVLEPDATTTGCFAKNRFPMNYQELVGTAKYLCRAYLKYLSNDLHNALEYNCIADEFTANDILASLIKAKAPIVLAGEIMPAEVHAVAAVINYFSGAFHSGLLSFSRIKPNSDDKSKYINELVRKLDSGDIASISFFENNAYYFLDDSIINKINRIDKNRRISISLIPNETDTECGIIIPSNHKFERWTDTITSDGYVTICQPAIEALNPESISPEEFLFRTFSGADTKVIEKHSRYRDFIRACYSDFLPTETDWEIALHDGLFMTKVQPADNVNLKVSNAIELLNTEINYNNINAIARPSHSFYDGTFSNVEWLAELPDPVTNQSWGNSLCVSSDIANKYDLSDGDFANVCANSEVIAIPVVILKDMADGMMAISLGYGNIRPNRSDSVGYNASKMLKYGMLGCFLNVHGKSLHSEKLISYPASFFDKKSFTLSSLTKGISNNYKYLSHKWAMAIDMNRCTGCGACVIACQSENNIPVVGPAEAGRDRIMQWIRLNQLENNRFMPLLCQHCENAPCEPVCPVQATSHSAEGINEMTYNRCIGARYCMANCPYNVRKFNYDQYSSLDDDKSKYRNNPHVTVRSRGIVEKCTFCVQRIEDARVSAAGKPLATDSFTVACAQACPTNAIVFGDLNDPGSTVFKVIESNKTYHLLAETGTKPSIYYIM
ncbi:MAG: 4Fe-4S dicluster domain-containing protein [Candidatus Kapaibacterium sp.]